MVSLPGHEDWVKALCFRHPDQPCDPLILASGSQDTTIRLWNIESHTNVIEAQPEEVPDSILDCMLAAGPEDEEGGRTISSKRHTFSIKPKHNTLVHLHVCFLKR